MLQPPSHLSGIVIDQSWKTDKDIIPAKKLFRQEVDLIENQPTKCPPRNVTLFTRSSYGQNPFFGFEVGIRFNSFKRID